MRVVESEEVVFIVIVDVIVDCLLRKIKIESDLEEEVE